MKLKKILIALFCLIFLIGYSCYAESGVDFTKSPEYQQKMAEIRQRNAGQAITTQPTNSSTVTPVPAPIPAPTPVTTSQQQPVIPDDIVIPTISVPNPETSVPIFVSNKKLSYNKIVETYSKLSKDIDNQNLCSDYINAVEEYRNTYGSTSLKSENINLYIPIMITLGYAYENTFHITEAITTLELVAKELPKNIDLKKHLLYLYDDTKSCVDAENMLSQIKRYEPSFNIVLINCNINNDSSYDENNDIYKTTNDSHNNDNKENGILWWGFLIIIAGSFAIESFKNFNKKPERLKTENKSEIKNYYQSNPEIIAQQEYDEKKRIQEEYRRRQLENQQLERERKNRELEEQKRKALKYAQRLQKNYWYNLDPYKFEKEIGELFKSLGYNVTVTPKSGDGGIDIIIENDSKIKVVQCKRYKGKVGAPEVQAFWGAKEYFEYKGKYTKADGAIMVALSGVTNKAKKIIQHFPTYELWTIDTIIAKAKEANYNYGS